MDTTMQQSGSTTAFSKVLIANRGEIALRVIRSAQRLGYTTVAVYSDADADALHVRAADEAVRIGPAAVRDSYLSIDAILTAARLSGAQAIHPGYGFLSERADFAQAVHDAGLIFIGPDAASIAAMGSKSAAKARMLAAGVPCVPGYQSSDAATGQSDEILIAEALKIGLPVMIKAAAGGGGRGMRLVHSAEALPGAVQSARSEATNAFGSGELLIEKAVLNARHVEIQIFGDRHDNVIHLGERDCSMQRRNQKVIEEAPSPAVDETLRAAMGAAAVAAAKAVDYVGAGTVEFMLAEDGAFYFLEMNTRLQVEHPVTEAIYGVDLVEWQLRVARGEALPLSQTELLARRSGWAIEVRLCAEDASQDYRPHTGTVLRWQAPAGARVDSGLFEGLKIGAHYDSMQAKLIVHGQTRDAAVRRLLHALDHTVLLGVTHNRDFLRALAADPAFTSGQFSTGFIGAGFAAAYAAARTPARTHAALAALALYLLDARALARQHALADEYLGWHSSHATPSLCTLGWREQRWSFGVAVQHDGRHAVTLGADTLLFAVDAMDEQGFAYTHDGLRQRAHIAREGTTLWLDAAGRCTDYQDLTLAPAQGAVAGSDGRLLAHSDGRVAAVHVQAGDTVAAGQTLLVLEAMKMEFQLSLPVAGNVGAVHVQVGQQVRGRQLLLSLT